MKTNPQNLTASPEAKELLAHFSGRFIRALPLRQGKAAEMDELMALFAPYSAHRKAAWKSKDEK